MENLHHLLYAALIGDQSLRCVLAAARFAIAKKKSAVAETQFLQMATLTNKSPAILRNLMLDISESARSDYEVLNKIAFTQAALSALFASGAISTAMLYAGYSDSNHHLEFIDTNAGSAFLWLQSARLLIHLLQGIQRRPREEQT